MWSSTNIPARLERLEEGQQRIMASIEALNARDAELEGRIGHAVDKMTAELVKVGGDIREGLKQMREGLIETRIARRLVVIKGRTLRWIERGLWALALALGTKIWAHVARTQGWDVNWWWPF